MTVTDEIDEGHHRINIEALKHRRKIEPYVKRIIKFWRQYKASQTNAWSNMRYAQNATKGKQRYTQTVGGVKKLFGSLRASLELEENDEDEGNTKREKRILKLASKSYKTMVENSKLGDALIVERCYVLLGTRPNDHSLLFSALQSLIEREDEVSSIIFVKQ